MTTCLTETPTRENRDPGETAVRGGSGLCPPVARSRPWSQRPLRWWSEQPVARAVMATAAVSYFCCVLLACRVLPVPEIHDEFSYLLAADTFAAGRWTNPTPALWPQMETFHVLQQPSYQSKYPPGQGLLLALGIVLFGHPVAGSWIGVGVAVGAMTWCLHGWLPHRWANLSALAVAAHPMLIGDWGQSYLAGPLPMAAGALLFGAVARWRPTRTLRASTAWAAGTGVALLAITRPYEGLIACTCCGAYALWQLSRARYPATQLLSRILLPGLITVGCGLTLLATYNQAVTGSWATLPYQAYQNQYGYSPLFVWQSPPAPLEYRHDVMREFYLNWEYSWYQHHFSVLGLWKVKSFGLRLLWMFYLGLPLTLPLLMVPYVMRRAAGRFLVISVAVGWCASQLVPWCFPHYFAPFAAPLLVVTAAAFRRLWYAPHISGPALSKAIVALQIMSVVVTWSYAAFHPRDSWEWQRQRVAEQLQATPGKHAVIVRYGQDHNVDHEWVYNRADVEQAKVIWLREPQDGSQDAWRRMLVPRQLWTLDADAPHPTVTAGYEPQPPSDPPQLSRVGLTPVPMRPSVGEALTDG